MRTLASIVMTLLFVAVLAPEVEAQKPSGEKTVNIEANLSCDGCKKTVETGLAKAKGVKEVKADPTTKMVTVTYDESKTSEEKLVKSIEKMGYKAKVSKGDKDCGTAKKDCDTKEDVASRKTGGGC
ncbi:heavy-metal-associated domain-containing protein [Perlabentimonas gracilis]|uniref:heavy-metal-associated domain-containing protein n=1 Tax=Perlabentimonas gracilis TaxID=2715279 RepID=UPI00140E9164|nr:heavy-metal-associated domain-containing protein [Perlabentimonas gracilis]NHB69790.1 heavy-metal-associated domain-containing protein [Perlabentimonas gracilis]